MTPSAGALLAERLRSRLGEIEATIFTRIEAVSDPRVGDPEYLLGLRSSVRTAIAYALEALQGGERAAGPVPAELLDQARKAARNGISLDTVLRRYLAGHTLLLDTVIREAGEEREARGALQEGLRAQARLLDRLLAAVAEEHSAATRELQRGFSTEARRLRAVERLLAGEAHEAPDLRYELSASHIALIACGADAEEALRGLASRLDRGLLLASPEEGTLWAWLGGRRPLDPAELAREASALSPPDLRIALGEPGEGVSGWRKSHRQARAAWPVAQRGEEAAVRYADVAILATVLQDDLLTDSLRELYLEPLEAERDGGETLRETLRAYFAAERNLSSAAAALQVSRQAVSSRLHMAENRIGRPLNRCAADMETALCIYDLGTAARAGNLQANRSTLWRTANGETRTR